jgi:hypothetical protein
VEASGSVLTGTVASALVWAGGFPEPGGLEGQGSTRKAGGFRSREASPSSRPLWPRPPPAAQSSHARPAGSSPGEGAQRLKESTKGFAHTLRTRTPAA